MRVQTALPQEPIRPHGNKCYITFFTIIWIHLQ